MPACLRVSDRQAVADYEGQGTGSHGKGVDKYGVTDDAEKVERGRLRDWMDMSFGVVIDVPDKAITKRRAE